MAGRDDLAKASNDRLGERFAFPAAFVRVMANGAVFGQPATIPPRAPAIREQTREPLVIVDHGFSAGAIDGNVHGQ